MDLKPIISKLHDLERKVLPVLKENTELSAIVKASKLQEIEVMRALQWLENKEVVKVNKEEKKIVILDSNGLKYKEEGFPERKFLESLSEEFQSLTVVAEKTKLEREELNACIGLLKRKLAIEVKKEEELMIKLGSQAEKILKEGTYEEKFLEKEFPLDLSSVKDVEKLAFDELKKRKSFLKVEDEKKLTIELTELGKELANEDLSGEFVNRLTTGMLKTGSWKDKQFRAYDVEINVPKVQMGKKHFVNDAVDYIKQIWMDLGFKEMTGNYVQSAFWDLDALFVPQDHPAREMQDTFYLNGKAKLPEFWEKIKEVHETGGETNSKGWQSKYSKEEAEKIMLRTHTTVLSAQTIAGLKKEDLPAKFFSVNKVFRNEALDWKHLFEFYQVEGIVIDPNANLKHLKGYLKEFYQKMGFSKVRMRPAHFPYTEPSVEVDVFHPVKKEWVELGGAGIFRPEVVKPLLGFECPVLAWGQGMGRIISEYWKIMDIRELYKNDLKQIREMKVWLK
ncbi:phenylalanine--tRNA ligase subunit alpha [Candidatus Woesearchaeota archaeon]|jgi:phenylalanyl-tRNA synthetase alpha chain|nr:phenylalanine--tRNA ligase subunit alpha [Candidatus Woesearchaeota archaeon]MBT4110339.1 phenylalanine--tRNA ligase subunit alpha [Candidatus Woesearchaeota archaeon]MBT4336137.1 phenylalanine--tRNA ligase subunit alpha [Candidatus Woesearchaeota archaeon]MBT4468884.1 phenylalanine--tRNA ligase subunit alpha [Candidatus Woesearchaeota archaeon]MBT6744797.1 phenylalanine--tRNA ligase subunit alpha [Candidatus Woesearchaeota archaeon]